MVFFSAHLSSASRSSAGGGKMQEQSKSSNKRTIQLLAAWGDSNRRSLVAITTEVPERVQAGLRRVHQFGASRS
jgi:hypothetical protein